MFHLAAQAGVRKSWGRDFTIYTVNNIEATQVLLEACAKRPIERLVYASSSSVYGDNVAMPMREDALPQPVSPYGVTKLAAEQLCYLYHVNYGVPTVSLRYFTVYGPRQRPDMGFHRFLRATLLGEPITLYGDGEQTRDFTFVADAVSATIAAGTRGVPGRVYNIGGGSRVSVNDVLEMIGRVSGRRPLVTVDPAQKGDMRHTYADTSLAQTDLGVPPDRVARRRPGRRVSSGWWTLCDTTAASISPRRAPRRAGCRGRLRPATQGHRADRHARAGQVSLRQGDRRAQRQEVAHRARVLQAGRRDLHAEPVSAGREARHRRHLPRRRAPVEALVLAINEFREFLSFYPTNRAPTTRSTSWGSRTSGRCARRSAIRPRRATPSRSSRPSSRAIPNSSLMPEVEAKLREARDRLSEADYLVGFFYYRQRWYPGAIDRFKALLKDDPEYTGRDAVYFYLAESYVKVKQQAQALPLYEQLVQEFEQSEYLEEARKRIAAKRQGAAWPGVRPSADARGRLLADLAVAALLARP